MIVGAMKCGTTALFHLLSRHPEIAPAARKEPDFFSRDETWARGREWYESLWEADPGAMRLEASVSYTKRHLFPRVVERMRETSHRFRFVYLVRDPVERIESHLRHAATDGWAVSGTDHLTPHLIATSRYAWQAEPYLEAFGGESLLVLDNADLAADPAGVARRVTDFLGLPPSAGDPEPARRLNPGTGRVRWNRLGRMLKPVLSHPVYHRVRRAVPASLRRVALPVLGERVSPEIALDAARVEALWEAIGDETVRFAERHGIDASEWFAKARGTA